MFCLLRDIEARSVQRLFLFVCLFVLVVPMTKIYYGDMVQIMQLDLKGKTQSDSRGVHVQDPSCSPWQDTQGTLLSQQQKCSSRYGMDLPREAH